MFTPGAEAIADSCRCAHHNTFEPSFCLKKSLLPKTLPTSAQSAAALAGARRPARRVSSDGPPAVDFLRLDRRLQHCPYRAQQREQRHAVQEMRFWCLRHWLLYTQLGHVCSKALISSGAAALAGARRPAAALRSHLSRIQEQQCPLREPITFQGLQARTRRSSGAGHAVQKGALLPAVYSQDGQKVAALPYRAQQRKQGHAVEESAYCAVTTA